MKRKITCCITLWILLFTLRAPLGWAQRTEVDPGFNIFSTAQEIEMGRTVAAEAEQQLSLVNDPVLAEYLNRLGQQLATEAPFENYPYSFKLVNDSSINAFALPGGPIYIHRGIFEAADREAEVAGVIGHEIAHVALRHGTNQASKAYIAQAPLAVLGGLFGGGSSVGSILTQLGIGFGANSLFLKFSRDAERQADLLGAQILFDAGYDPTGMTEFFEKLEAESGGRNSEFFSSHPNPGNRREAVAEEIGRLGRPPTTVYDNFSEFRRVKARLGEVALADPELTGGVGERTGTGRPPELPSTEMQSYQGQAFRISHPINWEVIESESAVTFAPRGGVEQATGALGYGVLASTFEPVGERRPRPTLERATDELIASLRNRNPEMRITEGYRRERRSGWNALTAGIVSESPFGGRERVRLLTLFGPGGRFYYFIGVAPEADTDAYERTFERIFDSIRFR